MKREIKFRAWHKKGWMCRFIEMTFFKDGSMHFTAASENNCAIGNTDDFVLMQYTGLKDKKRNEIYEGDIMCYDLEDCKDYHAVKYHNGGFVTGTKNLEPLHDELMYFKRNIYVVGNIYENPELLK